jgi:hypothetical protein
MFWLPEPVRSARQSSIKSRYVSHKSARPRDRHKTVASKFQPTTSSAIRLSQIAFSTIRGSINL